MRNLKKILATDNRRRQYLMSKRKYFEADNDKLQAESLIMEDLKQPEKFDKNAQEPEM